VSKLTGWKKVKLDEIKAGKRWAINGGPFGSNLVGKDYTDDGVPVIRGTNLSDVSKFSFDNFVFVSEEKADSLLANNAHPGDLVFTQRGTLGQVGIIPKDSNYERFVISQSQMKLTVDEEKADPEFVYYFFRSPKAIYYIHNLAISSGVPHINLQILKDFVIDLPPLPIQKRIAEILGALDNKIETNRRINRSLEQMAQALYKHWFVDFGPLQNGGFVDSKLGKIPEGWKVEPLGSHIQVQRGLSYKGSGLADAGLPLHNLNSIHNGGGYQHNGIKYYQEAYKERHTVNPGDLVVANTDLVFASEKIGSPALIPKRYGDLGLFSHHLYKIEITEQSVFSNIFLNQLLCHPRFRKQVANWASGTTVTMLPQDGLNKQNVVVPPKAVVLKFDRIIQPMRSQIEINEEEIHTLAQTRDYLLPKLLSGELEVKP